MTDDRTSDKVRFDGKNEDQFAARAARPARPGQPAGPPRPAGAGPARRDPGRPPAGRDRAALHACPRDPAGRLARDRRGGLRAARRRGVPAEPAGRRHPRGPRRGHQAGPSARRRRAPPRVRLPARPPGRLGVPAGGLAPQPPSRPRDRPERSTLLPGWQRRPGAADRARDLPQPGARDGRGPGRRRDLHRLRAGPGARGAGAARGRRAHDRRRGPIGPRVPRDAPLGGARVRCHPGRRARDPRGGARRPRRRRGRDHGGPPVPDRCRPGAGPPRRLADWATRRGAASSRTTTTPSSATTASPSARSRASAPTV